MTPAQSRPALLLVVTLAMLVCQAAPASGQSLPSGFVVQPIGSGWYFPVGLAFIDAHRLLVTEKAGKLWYVENDVRQNLVLDLESEALNNGDRGLIHVAVDPQFASNGFIYLLLAVDPTGPDDSDIAAFARLVRYTTTYANGSLTADPASRLDLIGDRWSTGFPSCYYGHTVGTLKFLKDGSLVCAAGDGAHFELVDAGGLDPDCFGSDRLPPDQDLGAFRAQYLPTLGGKILRVDPATGLGLPDNPFFDGDPQHPASRVWACGLRNPFKFALEPGPGPREKLLIADVGWDAWEEIDVAHGGENFGWPCYEGPDPNPSYQLADVQGFCAGSFTPPILAWNHVDPGTVGFTGECATGLEIYRGRGYPPLYRGALFFCDFMGSWMKVAQLDANDQVVQVLPFGDDLHYPVDLTTDPASGDLVYIALETNEILRIHYFGPRAGSPGRTAPAHP